MNWQEREGWFLEGVGACVCVCAKGSGLSVGLCKQTRTGRGALANDDQLPRSESTGGEMREESTGAMRMGLWLMRRGQSGGLLEARRVFSQTCSWEGREGFRRLAAGLGWQAQRRSNRPLETRGLQWSQAPQATIREAWRPMESLQRLHRLTWTDMPNTVLNYLVFNIVGSTTGLMQVVVPPCQPSKGLFPKYMYFYHFCSTHHQRRLGYLSSACSSLNSD